MSPRSEQRRHVLPGALVVLTCSLLLGLVTAPSAWALPRRWERKLHADSVREPGDRRRTRALRDAGRAQQPSEHRPMAGDSRRGRLRLWADDLQSRRADGGRSDQHLRAGHVVGSALPGAGERDDQRRARSTEPRRPKARTTGSWGSSSRAANTASCTRCRATAATRATGTSGNVAARGTFTTPFSPENVVNLTISPDGGHWDVNATCDPNGNNNSSCTLTAGQWEYRIFGGEISLNAPHDPQASNIAGPLADRRPAPKYGVDHVLSDR